MDVWITTHATIAIGVFTAGVVCVEKKTNREMARLLASAQPSIAIALSLWGLADTFNSVQGHLAADGMYTALSDKMRHMVIGIGAGLIQDLWVQYRWPKHEAEASNAKQLKNDFFMRLKIYFHHDYYLQTKK